MNKIYFLLALLTCGLTANVKSQCNNYYLTWIGVIDNGEGDGSHGPHGNLHLQLYDCNGRETTHKILAGPSISPNGQPEFLDGDQATYCLHIGVSSCLSYIKIWESDDDKAGRFELPGPSSWYGRKHDVLFEGAPKGEGFWWDSNRSAANKAMVNAQRRGAENWLYSNNLWNGRISGGIPKLFIYISCACN